MAAVFLMQPLGQLISQLVGLVVLVAYNHWYHLEGCKEPAAGVAPYCGRSIDTIWRWVTGVGAIPALVAIYFRFRIPDPGLYELDVNNEGDLAVRNTIDVYHQIPASHAEETMEMHGLVDHDHSEREDADLDVEAPLPAQFSYEDMHDYFWVQGNWRSVAGTSLCWFLLDL
jgi:PHS family inorganic phosphate transporter-like MFS transporter